MLVTLLIKLSGGGREKPKFEEAIEADSLTRAYDIAFEKYTGLVEEISLVGYKR